MAGTGPNTATPPGGGMQAIGGFPTQGSVPFGDNLMGAFNAFLTGRQSALQANQETKLKEAQVKQQDLLATQQNQAQAKTQLTQFASGLRPEQKSDPNVISQYQKLYKASGMVGNPLTTGPDGRQVLNTDDIMKKPWASATDQEQQYIASLQKGAQRDAYLDAKYYGVDPAIRNLPQVRTPQEQINDITQASKAIQLLGSGLGNPAQTTLTLQMLKNTFPDPEAMDQVINQLTDPTNAQIYLGPIAAAHAQQYTDLGLDQKAVADYKEMLVTNMPKKWAGELRVNQQKADTAALAEKDKYAIDLSKLATAAQNANAHTQEAAAAASRADSAAAEVGIHADANNIARLRVASGTLNQYLISQGNLYKTASAQANALIQNGHDIGDATDPNSPYSIMKQAHDNLIHSESVMANVQQKLRNGASLNTSTASGKTVTPPGGSTVQYNPGAQVPGHTGFTFSKQGKTVHNGQAAYWVRRQGDDHDVIWIPPQGK